MKQRRLNIIFAVGIIILGWLYLRHEKIPPQNQPINYALYKHKFEELQNDYNSLALQVASSLSELDSVKLKIIYDEIKIDNLSHDGIDSAFAVLLSKR